MSQPDPIPEDPTFARYLVQPLRPFPPMAEWVSISERELRTTFRIAIGLEIRSLPQLKGKGASRNRMHLEQAISMFADRVLESLVQSNVVFARGGQGTPTAQSLGSPQNEQAP